MTYNKVQIITYWDDDYIHLKEVDCDLKYIAILVGSSIVFIEDISIIPDNYVFNKLHQIFLPKDTILDFCPRNLWVYAIPQVYNFSKLTGLKFSEGNFSINKTFAKLFSLTYGFEFETSNNAIPGNTCKYLNMVPLFDGSITGYEYVTIPLKSETLIHNVKSIISSLGQYTKYNKDCSVHMHVGEFPIKIDAIKLLIKYWKHFQYIIQKFLPAYVFNTHLYKSSGKSYCSVFKINSFSQFFGKFTGNTLVDDDSLFLPNMYDEHEDHKWSVQGRYLNMNIMHLISGEEHKTIEFRFLPCTYKYVELEFWIVLLSCFVTWVINIYNSKKFNTQISLNKVISILPEDIANLMYRKVNLLKLMTKLQFNRGDFAGLDQSIKDFYFDNTELNIELFKCVE